MRENPIIVRCRYNAVNFLQSPHKIHPIARPLGRGMRCILWDQTLVYSLPLLLKWCMQYHGISDRVITALDSILATENGCFGQNSFCEIPKDISYIAIAPRLYWQATQVLNKICRVQSQSSEIRICHFSFDNMLNYLQYLVSMPRFIRHDFFFSFRMNNHSSVWELLFDNINDLRLLYRYYDEIYVSTCC